MLNVVWSGRGCHCPWLILSRWVWCWCRARTSCMIGIRLPFSLIWSFFTEFDVGVEYGVAVVHFLFRRVSLPVSSERRIASILVGLGWTGLGLGGLSELWSIIVVVGSSSFGVLFLCSSMSFLDSDSFLACEAWGMFVAGWPYFLDCVPWECVC